MVDAPKKNLSPLPVGTYRKSTKQSTWWCHQLNHGKIGFAAETVWVLEALRSLQSNKKLSVETKQEKYIISNEKKEKWIEDYEDRETAVVRNRVQDTVTAILQEQEHFGNVEKEWSTTTETETTFEKMLNAVGDSLTDQSSSHDKENWEDKDDYAEDTDLGKVS